MQYHVPCLIYCSFDVKLFCSFLIQCICNVNISLLPAAIFYISLTLESAAAVRYSSNTNTHTHIYPIRVGSRYFSISKNVYCSVYCLCTLKSYSNLHEIIYGGGNICTLQIGVIPNNLFKYEKDLQDCILSNSNCNASHFSLLY